MSLCPACQAPVQPDSAVCSDCGETLGGAAEVPACPSCGAEGEEGKFCTQCGSPLTEEVKGGGEKPKGRATRRLEGPPDWDQVRVTHLKPKEQETHPFKERFVIGRDRGDLTVGGDPFLSTQHAMIRKEKELYLLQDLGSRNGTFVRIRGEAELMPGDELMVGSQVFRYRIERGPSDDSAEAEGGGFRTQRLTAPNHTGPVLERVVKGRDVEEVFPLTKARTVIGREEGEICFPDDHLLSGAHASLELREAEHGTTHVVRDEESRNGVFLRVRDFWPLEKGDIFTAGRQVFRFDGEPTENDGEGAGG